MEDATKTLAKIILSTNNDRRRQYQKILGLIPFIDIHAKVITIEDEYVAEGERSERDLSGKFTIFDIFVKYEYIPVMYNLLENNCAKEDVQQLLFKFLEHGAELGSKIINDIVELSEYATQSLVETQNALDLITKMTNERTRVSNSR